MEFSHCDRDEKNLSLHDCIAERAYFENGKLGFEFRNGFWISPDHPESNLQDLVRTDFSKVEYTLEDGEEYDVTIYVFKLYVIALGIIRFPLAFVPATFAVPSFIA